MIFQDLNDILTVDCAGLDSVLSAEPLTVDNLTLKYSGNQVTKVSDSASNTSYTGASDFYDNNYREVEYEYDANGNIRQSSIL